MKKYLLLLLFGIAFYQLSFAQTYGNEIQAKSNPGIIGKIARANDNLKVYDSASLAKLTILANAVTSNKVQVDVLTMPSTTVTATNLSTNISQINGVTPLMGAGNTGTGSLRVTVASDQATIPVSLASVPSHAVTNAGTFAVQESGSALTALQLIDNIPNTLGSTTSGQSGVLSLGAVTTAAPSYTTAQTNALSLQTDGSLRVAVTSAPSTTVTATNLSTNISQINGVTPLMGAGNGGTGSLRVNIASDQVAIPVTLTSTTITGTVAVTKSGTWDITNAGTFAVQPASATAPVNTMNSASANSGVNSAIAGLFDDVSPTAITENNFGFLRMSANHNLYGTIRDAAGNERGANVNASNQLSVSVDNTVTVASHAVTNAGTFVVQENGSALTALQLIDNLPNTLGSTTSGQSGALALGAVTTSAPSYTTAQSNALSLQTDGSLRTAVTNTVTVSATNLSTNIAQINGVTPLMGNGTTGTGSPRVTLASDGTAISTTGYMSVKLDQTTPGTTNGVSLVPTTTGGLTTYHLVSAASTNATSVKASAGQLYGYYIFNANASARKVAFHNTSGTPTAGSSVFFSIVIPASSGANVEFSQAIAFSSGIGITTVTGTADSDATGVASGDLIINLFYK